MLAQREDVRIMGENLRAFIRGEDGIEAVAASHLLAEFLIVGSKTWIKR